MSKLGIREYGRVSEDSCDDSFPPCTHMQHAAPPSGYGICSPSPWIWTGHVTCYDQKNMVEKVVCVTQLAVSAFALLSGSPDCPAVARPLCREALEVETSPVERHSVGTLAVSTKAPHVWKKPSWSFSPAISQLMQTHELQWSQKTAPSTHSIVRDNIVLLFQSTKLCVYLVKLCPPLRERI